MTLKIYALPKLPNQLLGANWRRRARESRRWKKLVGQALAVTPLPNLEMPLPKARVHLVRCSPRQCDYDGLVGSGKAILDALVHHGVLVDDSPEFIQSTYEWKKTPTKEQCVVVNLEAMK